MINFEIDVSGEDLLNKDYTICIASEDGIIRGFKFDESLIAILSSRYGQGLYKYQKSQRGKATLKVRIYCIVIYYLFKSIPKIEELSLTICRDFQGREEDIRKNLNFFIENLLKIKLHDRIYFSGLDKNSNAHKYAFLMRKDTKNKLDTYVKINLSDIEEWIKK